MFITFVRDTASKPQSSFFIEPTLPHFFPPCENYKEGPYFSIKRHQLFPTQTQFSCFFFFFLYPFFPLLFLLPQGYPIISKSKYISIQYFDTLYYLHEKGIKKLKNTRKFFFIPFANNKFFFCFFFLVTFDRVLTWILLFKTLNHYYYN